MEPSLNLTLTSVAIALSPFFLFRVGDCSPTRVPSLQQALLIREGRAFELDLDRHVIYPQVRTLLERGAGFAVADLMAHRLQQVADVLLPSDALVVVVVVLQPFEQLQPVDGRELGVVVGVALNARKGGGIDGAPGSPALL